MVPETVCGDAREGDGTRGGCVRNGPGERYDSTGILRRYRGKVSVKVKEIRRDGMERRKMNIEVEETESEKRCRGKMKIDGEIVEKGWRGKVNTEAEKIEMKGWSDAGQERNPHAIPLPKQ